MPPNSQPRPPAPPDVLPAHIRALISYWGIFLAPPSTAALLGALGPPPAAVCRADHCTLYHASSGTSGATEELAGLVGLRLRLRPAGPALEARAAAAAADCDPCVVALPVAWEEDALPLLRAAAAGGWAEGSGAAAECDAGGAGAALLLARALRHAVARAAGEPAPAHLLGVGAAPHVTLITDSATPPSASALALARSDKLRVAECALRAALPQRLEGVLGVELLAAHPDRPGEKIRLLSRAAFEEWRAGVPVPAGVPVSGGAPAPGSLPVLGGAGALEGGEGAPTPVDSGSHAKGEGAPAGSH